jgi:hypothetical protein
LGPWTAARGAARPEEEVARRLLLAVVSSLFSWFTRDCRYSWDRSSKEMASCARREEAEDAVEVECTDREDMGV